MATTKKITREKEAEVAPVELPIFSTEGKQVGTLALPERLFGAPWKADLVHQVTTAMQANLRQNRANTKDRSEVSGGGKKPWKQKGTGQARHGSTRSPIWRHGGVTFGPRAERDYSEKVNKKMRMAALASVLSQKARDGEVILVDSFSFAKPKTSEARATFKTVLSAANASLPKRKNSRSALVALASHDANAVKSFRNMSCLTTEEARNLNPLDVMTYQYLIIEKPAEAFKALEARMKSNQ